MRLATVGWAFLLGVLATAPGLVGALVVSGPLSVAVGVVGIAIAYVVHVV